ncbi:CCR4-NOT transcription complex subunit 10 isoform X1 [Tripterygium wilfordii]|uniref:CCR4-NOT transcription complex subunit 10 isoform X1 n=1 Tax=Tripterygium wilfordii TaxID=458696 RepID=A0A7J7BVE1_TRIWF|nr:CCR4-NOT transcription complex subunit 10-like [Tripterygium wilfordii]KAF5725841.1 CCR4-NOT transcription complex subunit 10 isoform X1 [Tripterygium wilfordii]
MDSRDSSSQLPASNRDGPSFGAGDDDAFISATSAIAKEAYQHFQARRYVECLELLDQLLQKKPDDPKVIHNIAIAESCRDGCSDPKKLLEALDDVKKRNKKLAQDSEDQLDFGNKVNSMPKGSGNQYGAGSSASIVCVDEFDTSVATLNMAIVWFHLHEYAKALAVLEPLFQNIEPIDETTALHVCFLLLDVLIACNDAPKSANVLLYLEKTYGVGCLSQSDNGSVGQQAANLVAKSSSVPTDVSVTDAASSDLTSGVNDTENPLSRTLSEETLEYDSMFSLDIGGQNLQRPASISPSNDFLRTPSDKSITNVEVKLKLQLYKVRFLLLTGNLKQAKREVKHAMNISRGRDSSMALFLKAQLEYARGNHRKAIKLLMASGNRTETGSMSMFHNNLGCIYYQLGKCHTSSIFFSKALSNSSSFRKEKPLKLLTFSQDKSLLITYNCGVQYLVSGKPILATHCFRKASVMFYNRPVFWLRLAECCLIAFAKGLLKVSQAGLDIKVQVIGKGKWRQLAVENGSTRNGQVDSIEENNLVLGSDEQPKLSLPLARQCLFNALHILNSSEPTYLESGLPSSISLEEDELSETSFKNSNHKKLPCANLKVSTISPNLGQIDANGDSKEQKTLTSQDSIQNSVSYHEDVQRRESQMIKQALLANLAYVELELKNPLKALSTAISLLELAECSKIYIFLGHVYAAEALCMLNKPKEAADHLLVYLSGGNSFELPFIQEDCEQLRVERTVDCEESNGVFGSDKSAPQEGTQGSLFLKPDEARGALSANFAALSAMQGEFDRARHFVMEALSLMPNNPQATLTAVYLDLMLGKSQEALAKLKECSHVRFLPSSLQLNKSS